MHRRNNNTISWKTVDFTTVDLIRSVSDHHAEKLSLAETAALKRLVEIMGPDGTAWPSAKTIAKGIGSNERTARRAIKSLVRLGYIDREDDPGKVSLFRIVVEKIRNPPLTPDRESGVPLTESPDTPDRESDE